MAIKAPLRGSHAPRTMAEGEGFKCATGAQIPFGAQLYPPMAGPGLGYRPPKKLAEGEGFEPPVPCGTAVFKTAAFVHSATPPLLP